MELIEIKGLFEMDNGAPSPLILSNDHELILAFRRDPGSGGSEPPTGDARDYVLIFPSCINHRFGIPGSETMQGHPYARLGLTPNGFYELRQSDWVGQMENIEKIHPYYDAERWKDYKHYILTFHDNMLECVAKSFHVFEGGEKRLNSIATHMLTGFLKPPAPIDYASMMRLYVDCIRTFEDALRTTYHFDGIPTHQRSFPRKGAVTVKGHTVPYWFHGSGCDFEMDGITVAYDYCGDFQPGSVRTSPWKFLQFLQSHPTTKGLDLNEFSAHMGLAKLEAKGIVRLSPGSLGAYVFMG